MDSDMDNEDYESFLEENPEDGERIAEELDQDDNYEIILTDQDQLTSEEDDCCVENEQPVSEEEAEEVTICSKRSHKTLSNYNPQADNSYAQRKIKTTGVVKTKMFKSSREFLGDTKLRWEACHNLFSEK